MFWRMAEKSNKNEVRNFARRYAKEYNVKRFGIQLFAIFISYVFFKLAYDIKVEGRENLPKGSRYIYAGNHVSMFDPLFVSIAVFRPIAYMAKIELFGDNALGWWVKRLGAFAVNRQKPELSTFKTVKDIFKNTNWALGIFPQGGIKDNKKIENIQKGFAIIAKNAKSDIIPVAISGFESYVKEFSDYGKQHIVIKLGKPISCKLEPEEILAQWTKFICDNTGFENCMTVQTGDKDEEIVVH